MDFYDGESSLTPIRRRTPAANVERSATEAKAGDADGCAASIWMAARSLRSCKHRQRVRDMGDLLLLLIIGNDARFAILV
jgi:hypothetical protein